MQTKMSIAAHVWYMTKTLRNTIMKRTELETKYLKNKTGIKLKEYKKQRDFCIVNFTKKKGRNITKIWKLENH